MPWRMIIPKDSITGTVCRNAKLKDLAFAIGIKISHALVHGEND